MLFINRHLLEAILAHELIETIEAQLDDFLIEYFSLHDSGNSTAR